MQLAVQLMMGVSLAACAGLRAWLPLLVMGALDRAGYAHFGPPFDLLARTDVLVALGVATVVEILGDKIPAVDHVLDSAALFVRPAAGTVLAASALSGLDPGMSLLIGLIVGGGTAMTVNAGKMAVRIKSTATAPLHGGLLNTGLSVAEDVGVTGLMFLALKAPMLAFAVVVVMLLTAVLLVIQVWRLGARLLRGRRAAPPP